MAGERENPWENLRAAIVLPKPLSDVLKTHSEQVGTPFNELTRQYVLQGLEADGVVLTDEDRAAIEQDLEQMRYESDPQREKEGWDALVRETLGQ